MVESKRDDKIINTWDQTNGKKKRGYRTRRGSDGELTIEVLGPRWDSVGLIPVKGMVVLKGLVEDGEEVPEER